jgi:hypothetical protein
MTCTGVRRAGRDEPSAGERGAESVLAPIGRRDILPSLTAGMIMALGVVAQLMIVDPTPTWLRTTTSIELVEEI